MRSVNLNNVWKFYMCFTTIRITKRITHKSLSPFMYEYMILISSNPGGLARILNDMWHFSQGMPVISRSA